MVVCAFHRHCYLKVVYLLTLIKFKAYRFRLTNVADFFAQLCFLDVCPCPFLTANGHYFMVYEGVIANDDSRVVLKRVATGLNHRLPSGPLQWYSGSRFSSWDRGLAKFECDSKELIICLPSVIKARKKL